MKIFAAVWALASSFATADESLHSQRFSIVQTASRTFLLNHESGDTWVLLETPRLRWQEVSRDSLSPPETITTVDQQVPESQMQITAKASKSGENVFVRATVTNPTATPHEHIWVSLIPGKCEVANATTGMLKIEGTTCVWRIPRLDAGETKTFEAQLRHTTVSAGKSPSVTWTIRERSGAFRNQTVEISVNEPEE